MVVGSEDGEGAEAEGGAVEDGTVGGGGVEGFALWGESVQEVLSHGLEFGFESVGEESVELFACLLSLPELSAEGGVLVLELSESVGVLVGLSLGVVEQALPFAEVVLCLSALVVELLSLPFEVVGGLSDVVEQLLRERVGPVWRGLVGVEEEGRGGGEGEQGWQESSGEEGHGCVEALSCVAAGGGGVGRSMMAGGRLPSRVSRSCRMPSAGEVCWRSCVQSQPCGEGRPMAARRPSGVSARA